MNVSEIKIPTELICTVITAIGSAIAVLWSGHIAKRDARNAAAEEINRMKLAWDCEDIVSSDDEFAELAESVARFVYYNSGTHQEEALAKIAAIRSKESGSIGTILDELYEEVLNDRCGCADKLLSKVIDEKRKMRTKSKSE